MLFVSLDIVHTARHAI